MSFFNLILGNDIITYLFCPYHFDSSTVFTYEFSSFKYKKIIDLNLKTRYANMIERPK